MRRHKPVLHRLMRELLRACDFRRRLAGVERVSGTGQVGGSVSQGGVHAFQMGFGDVVKFDF